MTFVKQDDGGYDSYVTGTPNKAAGYWVSSTDYRVYSDVIKESVDLTAIRDDLELDLPWTMVESEGMNCVRFDNRDRSVWIYSNGSIDGLKTFPPAWQQKIKETVHSYTEQHNEPSNMTDDHDPFGENPLDPDDIPGSRLGEGISDWRAILQSDPDFQPWCPDCNEPVKVTDDGDCVQCGTPDVEFDGHPDWVHPEERDRFGDFESNGFPEDELDEAFANVGSGSGNDGTGADKQEREDKKWSKDREKQRTAEKKAKDKKANKKIGEGYETMSFPKSTPLPKNMPTKAGQIATVINPGHELHGKKVRIGGFLSDDGGGYNSGESDVRVERGGKDYRLKTKHLNVT